MSPKDADRMTNSADPYQTAPSHLGLTCLPETILSENLGLLQYGISFPIIIIIIISILEPRFPLPRFGLF